MPPRAVNDYLASAKHKPLLLDVREPEEFRICNIPGSRLMPMNQIPAQLDQLDPEQELILVCHHGIRSQQVAYFLEQHGFKHLINLAGGIAAWADDVDPDMRRY